MAALIDVAPLRSSPQFRRLWLGRVCSMFGGQMTLVAVMYQLWDTTHSTAWTGAAALAQALPLVAFGLFAGALVDRTDRRRLYLLATAGAAACSALLAAQGFAGGVSAPVVLLVLALQSTFASAGGPAARTFVSRLLPDEQVAAGLALNRVAFQGSLLLGPAIGGAVISWGGVGVCYLLDALSFGAALLAAAGLPPMRPDGAPAAPGLRAVAEGLRFLLATPPVRGALLTDLAATVLSMPLSLFPLVNAERFGNDPRTLGLFLSAIAAGGIVASVLSGTFTSSPRPGAVMLLGSAAWGVSLAAFALAPDPWSALACLVVAGAADTVAVVCRSTVVQLHTPDALLGRVAAAEQIVGQAGPDVGNFRAGLLAVPLGATTTLVSGGALCVLAVAAVARATPSLTAAAGARGSPAPGSA
ncbi:MFS transporter [Dactylosporangium sp. NPDC005572]|uniref:MFS transporter n=1 Tax=Dactylosporangium sp. NPDC005572 TaxID=3156889 RepID=UPI0033ADEFC7